MTLGANQIAAYAADLLDLDQQIDDLQTGKRDTYKAIRDEHGKAEADALKRAVKLFRMDGTKRDEAEAVDTEAQRMLAIIEKGHAPRATRPREIIEEFGAEGSRPEAQVGGAEPQGGVTGSADAPGQDESARIAPAQSAAASISEPAGQTVEQGGEGGAALPADESTAALMEVPVGSETPTADDPGDRGGAAGTQAPPVDTNSAPADQSGNVDGTAGRSHSARHLSTESPGGVPLDTQSRPLDITDAAETSLAGAEGDADRPTNSAALNALKMRPLCLHADDLTKCGGYGHVTCHTCLKAHADAEGISA